MMRGTRSRYLGSIRFSQRSGGSLAWQSVETTKYLFGSSARMVRAQPSWPGVSSRHRFGALIATSFTGVPSCCRAGPSAIVDATPLDQRVRRIGIIVRLEHRLDGRTDRHLLAWRSEEHTSELQSREN